MLLGGCGDGGQESKGQEGGINQADTASEKGVLGARDKSHDGEGVLYVGIAVHLEGWKGEAEHEQKFRNHAALLREYAAMFERHGARLTLEAGSEFVRACQRWGDDVLLELQQRGHGIGIHADLGGKGGMTQDDLVEGLRSQVRAAQSLGCEIRHASGISSELDWVKVAEEAGLAFVDCVVEYALKSIPPKDLPEEYRWVSRADQGPSELHGPAPSDFEDRVYPWKVDSARNWLWEDPDGKIVILDSEGASTLPNLAEEAENAEASGGQSGGKGKAGGYGASEKRSFDRSDVEEFMSRARKAQAYTSSDRATIFYVTWSLGQALDPGVLEELLVSMDAFTETGRVQWKTLPEAYDAYVRAGK
jgi:hypothetical protein